MTPDDVVEAMALPRCGDHVLHRPSGETWVVAWADADDLAWAGYPVGIARTINCQIVKRATEAEHRAAVEEWSRSTSERRRLKVMTIYGAALAAVRAAAVEVK